MTALKDSFGPDIPRRVAEMVQEAMPNFPVEAFVTDALDGYDELELTPRARQISDALAAHLPDDRARALEIILGSLGSESDADQLEGMEGFLYLPFVYFVADHGTDHFELSMQCQYELTKRFTAEFSIRTFLDREPERTLAVLAAWAEDPNVHVRRLVSEGSRPRLPWAARLRRFQEDPGPVLALLELLKHDGSEYVRRSVANNLNDVAKDHPDLVLETARRWWPDASHDERRMIRHGLRTLVKQGNLDALAVLGFGPDSPASIESIRLDRDVVEIGERVQVIIGVHNPSTVPAGALVDFRVHFVKANGTASPKVFKGRELHLAPGASEEIRKTVSLRQHSTRTHYPGEHRVDVLLNGVIVPGPHFLLV